jgi:hypothetical protein
MINIYHCEKKLQKKKKKKKIKKEKNTFSCKYCKKSLSSKQMCDNHMKRCKDKIDQSNKSNDNNEEIDNKQLLELMTAKMEELKKQIKNNPTTNNVLIKNATIKNANINNATINLVAYDETDGNKLGNNDILQCMKKKINCVPAIIENVHFNNKRPEHMNILLENHRDNYIKIFNGKKWVLMSKEEVIEDLIDKNNCLLFQTVEAWKKRNKFTSEINKFSKYIDAVEDEDNIDKIKEKVVIILYNNRDKVPVDVVANK